MRSALRGHAANSPLYFRNAPAMFWVVTALTAVKEFVVHERICRVFCHNKKVD